MTVGCAVCRIVCEEGLPTDWVYLSANPSYLAMTGLQDVVGRKISDLMPSLLANCPEVLKNYAEVALDSATRHFEVFVKPLGIWVNVRAFSPEPEMFIATLENISATKKAEADLRSHERQFRTLAETVNDEIWTMDLKGRFTYVSPSVQRLRGFTQAEAMSQGLEDILGPADLARANSSLQDAVAAAADGRTIPEFRTEWQEFRKDGTKVWTEVRANELRNEEGHIIGFLGISRDVTDRKAAEDKYRKVLTAVEQNSTSIVITDHTGLIEYVNPKFAETTGYTPEEVMGKRSSLLKSDRHLPSTYVELWKTITAGQVWKGELCNRKKSGDYHWEGVIISPIKDDRGVITAFVGVKEDISERKLVEEERERLIRELTEALGEVRQLSGLLPICAHCKKIRDDKGYWNQIEAYISHHSKAAFSHGICPECADTHFPEFRRKRNI